MFQTDEVIHKIQRLFTYQINKDGKTGMAGIMGHNIYKFNLEDRDAIFDYLENHTDLFAHCFNEMDLAQTMVSELLAAGYLSWDASEIKKKVISI